MVPIISFVGRANSGKTTFLVKLIQELKQRGYRVAVLKHHHGDFEFDRPGKDTWLHAEAGADIVMISSPSKMAMIKKIEQELSLKELVLYASGVDLIITEGYKHENASKIEILRSAISKEPVCNETDLLAIVTDVRTEFSIPKFALEDVNAVADFLIDNLNIQKSSKAGETNV